MDVVGSPSSVCSAVSVDRSRDVGSRRSRRRQRPTSTDQKAQTNEETMTPFAGGTRTASWGANFDNLLRDCAGLATFSVSDQRDQIASLFAFGCVFCGVRKPRDSSLLAYVIHCGLSGEPALTSATRTVWQRAFNYYRRLIIHVDGV